MNNLMKMGVVADDVTGANDIGIMFAKNDYLTHVYSIRDGGYAFDRSKAQPNIVILDTNSRLDAPELAYEKAAQATRLLQAAGCRQFFNKTCSVFRGNIGAEFDAMLDVLEESFAVVVLGFPKNGRLTRDAIHTVHGVPLAESEFRADPIHPMRQSNLVDILQSQTTRRVRALNHEVVSRGPAALRQAIAQMRDACNYLILDVIDQDALAIIAAAVPDEPVLCGSSALAEELPAVWGAPRPTGLGRTVPPRNGRGVLCAAGSLMPQTAAQVAYLRRQGLPVFTFEPEMLFAEQPRRAMIARLVAALAEQLRAGADAVLHTPQDPRLVAETRRLGAAHGLDRTAVARLVSTTLAEITAQVVAQAGLNRLVIAGGETSAAVCARLGVTGMQVWREIQAGLPSCLTLSQPPLFLVLKSGSFGTPAFLEEAIDHLRRQEAGR